MARERREAEAAAQWAAAKLAAVAAAEEEIAIYLQQRKEQLQKLSDEVRARSRPGITPCPHVRFIA